MLCRANTASSYGMTAAILPTLAARQGFLLHWVQSPPQTNEVRRSTALIETAGVRATETVPLAWLGMASDGATKAAALTLRLWPRDQSISLGLGNFHGRWVDWAIS